MARPRSIYERETNPTLPPPEFIERTHVVVEGETLISIAKLEYGLSEYDPDLLRLIVDANNIENPFTFAQDFRGKTIRIPARPLPDFS